MMLPFFQKNIPFHDIINFKYIFAVLLIFFVKPKHLVLMKTLDLHERFFYYDYLILFSYLIF